MVNEFSNVMTQQSHNADYVYLLEAISAVLGAQREPKVDLVEEPSSSNKDSSGQSQVSDCDCRARGYPRLFLVSFVPWTMYCKRTACSMESIVYCTRRE